MQIRMLRDLAVHRDDRSTTIYRCGARYSVDDATGADLVSRSAAVAEEPSVADRPYWTIPRLWPGETVVCLGGGPSLTQADVDYCRGKARVIGINDAYRLAPWADLLYFCDNRWYEYHVQESAFRAFAGLKVKLEPAVEDPKIKILRNGDVDGRAGLDQRPDTIKTGRNSGYQVINLAVHLGARRIVLLGYDMKPTEDGRTHWFGEHPWPTSPAVFAQTMRPQFDSLTAPMAALGVSVVNASRDTALETFPVQSLADCLLPRS